MRAGLELKMVGQETCPAFGFDLQVSQGATGGSLTAMHAGLLQIRAPYSFNM
jgi:hypothetical protein